LAESLQLLRYRRAWYGAQRLRQLKSEAAGGALQRGLFQRVERTQAVAQEAVEPTFRSLPYALPCRAVQELAVVDQDPRRQGRISGDEAAYGSFPPVEAALEVEAEGTVIVLFQKGDALGDL